MKVLVAGFGNLLREDDGFGVALLKNLQERDDLPAGVTLLEAGIGGISLVQELLDGFDAVIVLDALEGESAGRIKVLAAEVPDAADVPRDFLADTHYAEPGRALVLAKAVGVLPAEVYIVGCVAQSAEIGETMTPAVQSAVAEGAGTVIDLIRRISTAAAPPAARVG